MDYGFVNLNADSIFGIADCENIGSNRILSKLGMQNIEMFEFDNVNHFWYQLKKEMYKK
jgi:ribosomal-protein-alanine N-acetyltransferase